MIVHLVRLNKCHQFRPHRFSLPSVEVLAFLIQAHSMGLSRLSLGSHCLDHLNDTFLRELEGLRLSAEPGAPLLASHIDLTNAFWSLTLPEPYKNSFRVRIDGPSYAFSCLPFGWRFSPVICQYVLAFVTGPWTPVVSSCCTIWTIFWSLAMEKPGWDRCHSACAMLCARRGLSLAPRVSLSRSLRFTGWVNGWCSRGTGRGSSQKGRGGCFTWSLDSGCGAAPYTQALPSYPGTFYLEPAPDGWVRPFLKWLVGPLLVGAKLASKLPPVLGPEPPALPLAFL